MRPKGQNIGTQSCVGNLRGTVAAFNNIYYSSYPQTPAQISKVGETIPKFGVSPIKDYTNGIDAKVYDSILTNNVVNFIK